MASRPITSQQIDEETTETVTDFIFLGSKITADGDCSHEIKTLAPWKKSYDQPGQHIKKQRRYFADKGPSNQSYGFSSSHVWMWELDYKESWAPKNWCFWAVVLKRLLRIPWTKRRSNQLILKEINPEYSLEGLMLKLKLQYFGHLRTHKSWLIRKDPDAGKDWGHEEKGATEDEMVGWHHQLNGQTPGDSGGQGSLTCCSPWGHKELAVT